MAENEGRCIKGLGGDTSSAVVVVRSGGEMVIKHETG